MNPYVVGKHEARPEIEYDLKFPELDEHLAVHSQVPRGA